MGDMEPASGDRLINADQILEALAYPEDNRTLRLYIEQPRKRGVTYSTEGSYLSIPRIGDWFIGGEGITRNPTTGRLAGRLIIAYLRSARRDGSGWWDWWEAVPINQVREKDFRDWWLIYV